MPPAAANCEAVAPWTPLLRARAFNGRYRADCHHPGQGLHATVNLFVTLLITPLGIDMTQPFLIFTALLTIASIAVIRMTGSTNLSRMQRKQTSEDVPTFPLRCPRADSQPTAQQLLQALKQIAPAAQIRSLTPRHAHWSTR